ncbi:hypothetical protein [Hymenobacter sp. B81]|uniref:hypothetical protein n=1 Tax=Hymenobacter sp. B81 TaxID=3344878 RepID=UPI0037DC4933
MSGHWQAWGKWGLLALSSWLAACAPTAETDASRPAPTGRYEGKLTYRGSALPVVINLYQDSASQAVQLQLRVPQLPVFARWFDSVSYQAPALNARLVGGRLALREETNFLTGSIWLHDTLRAELVAVRRGTAELPTYRVLHRPAAAGLPPHRYYLPVPDSGRQRPVVLLLPAATAAPAAQGWADWLAAQGVAVAVLPLGATAPDSVAARQLRGALRQLKTDAVVRADSSRIGVWSLGPSGRAVVQVAADAGAVPAFLLLQGGGFTTADRALLRQLARRRRPVLALYGGADTTVNGRESSRQLRQALGGRRGAPVRVYADANAQLLRPTPATDSVRSAWPQLPPELLPGLQQWLQGVLAPRR